LEVIVSIIYTYIKKFLNPFAKVLKKFSKVLKNPKNGMRALWCKSLFSLFFQSQFENFKKWTRNKCPKLNIGELL